MKRLALFMALLTTAPVFSDARYEELSLSSLSYSLKRLEQLADGVEDPKIQKVMSYAKEVLERGSKARPSSIERALKDTRRAIRYIKQKKPTVGSKVQQHLSQIQTAMQSILSTLEENATSSLPVAITSLPYTISKPGKYYVPNSLSYAGAGSAITVAADNVTINFYNNALTLTNANAIAISLNTVKECTIENGIIQGPVLGLKIASSSGVHIQNTFLNGAYATLSSAQGIEFTGSSFEAGSLTNVACLSIANSSEHITISNCTFNNWAETIAAQDVSAMQINDTLIRGSGALLTLGDSSSQANDLLIQNSTFVLTAGTVGIDFIHGSGCLLENVLLDAACGDAIHIGSIANNATYNSILAKSCLITGSPDYGIYVEQGTNVSCSSCQFTDAKRANVLLASATGCIFTSCKLSDSDEHGIVLTPNANQNAVIDCEVSDNSQNGVVVQAGAKDNQIIRNNVFDNGNYGLFNSDASTSTFYNISCNNGVSDCPQSGVTPEQAPGVSTLVPGSNICCVP